MVVQQGKKMLNPIATHQKTSGALLPPTRKGTASKPTNFIAMV
jgi:hypothetical protein